MSNDKVDKVDTLAPPAMAAWLRETAANTRQHSDPAWCAARALPYDPVAGHVAFRMEQAAELIEQQYHLLSGIATCAEFTACELCRDLMAPYAGSARTR